MRPAPTAPVVALLRFHAASGVRVAMRAAIPLAGAITVAIGLTPSPAATLRALAAEMAAPHPSTSFVVATLTLAFGLAGWAAPRLTSGAGGWLRSLPCDAATRRRALALGVAAALAPLALTIAVFSFFGGFSVERVVALVPLMVGAGYAVLPRRRAAAAALATTGAVAAIAFGWPGVLLGAVLVATADLVAGGEQRARPPRSWRSRAAATPWRLALRASASLIPEAWALAALPVVAGLLFTRNNALAPELAARALRLAVGTAAVVSLSVVADRLAVLRPVWRWARSLPWTSRRRVVLDAAYLGAVAIPVVLVFGILAPGPAALAAIAVPTAALRAAGAMRRGTTAPFVLEGILGALTLALLPWSVALAAAAMPLVLRAAARDEARLRVSRFAPVLHRAAGDPSSWAGR
jgi:hypothetical protein